MGNPSPTFDRKAHLVELFRNWHLGAEEFIGFDAGELSPEWHSHVANHLERCAECAERLEQYRRSRGEEINPIPSS